MSSAIAHRASTAIGLGSFAAYDDGPMTPSALSPEACTEALVLLVAMAWADGKLESVERDGVRAAASTFDLPEAVRARVDRVVERPIPVDELLVETLSPAERAFAFVLGAWLARVDGEVDPREAALLEKAAHLLELDGARVAELSALAAELPARAEGDGWAGQLKGVFVAAAARVLHA